MGFFENYSNRIINRGYLAFLNCLSSTELLVFNCIRTINYEIDIFLDHKESHIDIGKHLDALVFTLLI